MRSVAKEHHHSSTAVGVTGTGFYCGRHYRWSEFERDENRPLFITAARRSLIGWVYVDSTGQQVASCTNHAQFSAGRISNAEFRRIPVCAGMTIEKRAEWR